MACSHLNPAGDEFGQTVDGIINPLFQRKCSTLEEFRSNLNETTKKHLPHVLPAMVIPCFSKGESRRVAVYFKENEGSGIMEKEIWCYADSSDLAAAVEQMRRGLAAAVILASLRKETITIWLSESSPEGDTDDGIISYDSLFRKGFGPQLEKAYEALGYLREFQN